MCEVTGAESEAVEADEASRIALVIPALYAFHRCDLVVVERILRLASGGDDVPLVELQANGAGDELLTFVHESLQRLAFWREPKSVVNEFGVFRDEAVAQMLDLAIHREAFDLLVGLHEDGAARCLVDTTAFHADEAVLDEVNAADAMLAAKFVEGLENLASASCR